LGKAKDYELGWNDHDKCTETMRTEHIHISLGCIAKGEGVEISRVYLNVRDMDRAD
jgi:hypothetical protein